MILAAWPLFAPALPAFVLVAFMCLSGFVRLMSLW
jgi:hypothetical protein